jgi:hypothetical protein
MVDATLVTIHGFWSSPATWDRLDAIWNADEQLRCLRIHPWRYRVEEPGGGFVDCVQVSWSRRRCFVHDWMVVTGHTEPNRNQAPSWVVFAFRTGPFRR